MPSRRDLIFASDNDVDAFYAPLAAKAISNGIIAAAIQSPPSRRAASLSSSYTLQQQQQQHSPISSLYRARSPLPLSASASALLNSSRGAIEPILQGYADVELELQRLRGGGGLVQIPNERSPYGGGRSPIRQMEIPPPPAAVDTDVVNDYIHTQEEAIYLLKAHVSSLQEQEKHRMDEEESLLRESAHLRVALHMQRSQSHLLLNQRWLHLTRLAQSKSLLLKAWSKWQRHVVRQRQQVIPTAAARLTSARYGGNRRGKSQRVERRLLRRVVGLWGVAARGRAATRMMHKCEGMQAERNEAEGLMRGAEHRIAQLTAEVERLQSAQVLAETLLREIAMMDYMRSGVMASIGNSRANNISSSLTRSTFVSP